MSIEALLDRGGEPPRWLDELDVELLALNALHPTGGPYRLPVTFTYHRSGSRTRLTYLRWTEPTGRVRYWRDDVLRDMHLRA